MMRGSITKTTISLELRVDHTHVICQLKAPIYRYLMIWHRCPLDSNQKKSRFKTLFFFYLGLSFNFMLKNGKI